MADAPAGKPHDPSDDDATLAGMRIVIVLGPLELGGSERQALLLARYLKKEQHADVQIWGTMGEPGRLAVLCDEYEIPWRIVPNPWVGGRIERLKRLAAFARQLRRTHPDIILPYMEMPNVVCGLVWRWTGALLCVWNQRDDGVARIQTRYGPWAIRFTPHFIANSRTGAEHLVRSRSVPKARVHIVYNGVELGPEPDREKWRRQLGLCDHCFTACMVANMTVFKDHVTLLRAWKLVADKLKSVARNPVLLLAGRFDETHERLQSLVHDLNLKDSVHFLGPVDDVPGLLSAVDAGILCSNSEGSPNSVLEYMAAGLPVAGTDIPAMREVLTTNNHALLAPVGDHAALAARIIELAFDHELRARLGKDNRNRVEGTFGVRRMCEETTSIIVNGLQGARR